MNFLPSKIISIFIFFTALFITTIACHQNNTSENVQTNHIQQNISNNNNENKVKNWERIYFNSINEKLNDSKISSLQGKKIDAESLEIRIWVGFDESELKGIVLEKKNGNWTGFYLPQKSKSAKKIVEIKLQKNGWQNFEGKLKENDFYNFPDITESKDNLYNDARCIVVEIKTSENYKNFMQIQHTDLKDYPELKSFHSTKLTDICKFIEKEFNVSLT
jgi:hypothetical protein